MHIANAEIALAVDFSDSSEQGTPECQSQCASIAKSTNWSGIDRTKEEVNLAELVAKARAS
jgi:hypothetical protein